MTDRIVLSNLQIEARHGVEPREKVELQRFEVDVELHLDLAPAGRSDDLAKTIDYAAVDRRVREIVTSTSFDLIEALAERIASDLLADQPLADAVVVRIRKPDVRLAGPLDGPAVEITRRRGATTGGASPGSR
jgi:dihydroneopterin aldolase